MKLLNRKDIKRIRKSGRFDVEKLLNVVEILESGGVLPMKYKDHSLKGWMEGMRECHIEPNWLLIYEKRDDILVLYLLRTGSHNEIL